MKLRKKTLIAILIFFQIAIISFICYKNNFTCKFSSNNKTCSIPIQDHKFSSKHNQLLVEKIKCIGNSEQVIIVTTDYCKTIHSNITCFEKNNGSWRQIYSMPGVIGINGFSSNRKEGDLTTPIGKYSLGFAFGKYDNPGTKMPYKQTSAKDIWSDDSKCYNTWVTDSSIKGEHLLRNDWLYDYAFVINFNIDEKIVGKGSGLFFHCWRSSDRGTEGCIAADKYNVIQILKWLDPYKNPIIIQGPMSEVLKM